MMPLFRLGAEDLTCHNANAFAGELRDALFRGLQLFAGELKDGQVMMPSFRWRAEDGTGLVMMPAFCQNRRVEPAASVLLGS